MAESSFQKKVASRFRAKGNLVLVISVLPGIPSGFPDILILSPNGKWALLECKRSATASFRPLQKRMIEKFNRWSYARAVHPENWIEIQKELDAFL